MNTKATKDRKFLFSLAAVMLLTALLAPPAAEATRYLPNAHATLQAPAAPSFDDVDQSGAAAFWLFTENDVQLFGVLALLDSAGNVIQNPPTSLTFTHRGKSDVFWSKPSETPLLSATQVGNDRFLHSRPYVKSVGLYDHRARFYDPGTMSFLQPRSLRYHRQP